MRKLSHLFLFIACTLFSFNLQAQADQTVFNNTDLRLSGGWGGPFFGITQLNNDYVSVKGGFGGVELGKNFFVGFASYKFGAVKNVNSW